MQRNKLLVQLLKQVHNLQLEQRRLLKPQPQPQTLRNKLLVQLQLRPKQIHSLLLEQLKLRKPQQPRQLNKPQVRLRLKRAHKLQLEQRRP